MSGGVQSELERLTRGYTLRGYHARLHLAGPAADVYGGGICPAMRQ